jgi:hypothetical protein
MEVIDDDVDLLEGERDSARSRSPNGGRESGRPRRVPSLESPPKPDPSPQKNLKKIKWDVIINVAGYLKIFQLVYITA